MGEVRHIVFSDASKGVLGFYLRTKDSDLKGEILGIREDYSIGPIHKIGTNAGMNTRISWLKDMLDKVSIREYFEEIDKDLYKTYDEITDIKEDSKVVIWHANNTSDQIGLRFVLKHLNTKNVHEVNVSETKIKNENNEDMYPISLGQCHPTCVGKIIKNVKPIDKVMQEQLSNEWDELKTTTDSLRILENDIIIGVEEKYFDKDILLNCDTEFINAAEVVGSTMGSIDHLVGDSFLDYRVRNLIDEDKLEYRGKLDMLRHYDVRIKVNT